MGIKGGWKGVCDLSVYAYVRNVYLFMVHVFVCSTARHR